MRKFAEKAWREVMHFLHVDVWDSELTTLPWFRRRLAQLTRIVQLVAQGFRDDNCPLHASALTYYTLMALIPVLALALSLSRVFGGEALARNQMRKAVSAIVERIQSDKPPAKSAERPEGVRVANPAGTKTNAPSPGNLPPPVEHTDTSREFARTLQEQAETLIDQILRIDLTTLGSVGLVLLIWMVMGVLGRIEKSFNRVWAVKSSRPIWRKFTDYLSVLLILPLLATAASSIPIAAMIGNHVPLADGLILRLVDSVFVRRALTVTGATAVFAFVLIFMPNTKVRLVPGLAGGLVTALLFMAWLKLCTSLQLGVARYSSLYGGFATVPILLAWVFVSWEIVLFGSELAFAAQNGNNYRMDQGARRASQLARLLLGFAVASECARRLHTGERFRADAFSARLGVSPRLLNDVLSDLEAAGLIAPVANEPETYVFCRNPNEITAGDVFLSMLNIGAAPREVGLKRPDRRILEAGEALEAALRTAFDQPLHSPTA